MAARVWVSPKQNPDKDLGAGGPQAVGGSGRGETHGNRRCHRWQRAGPWGPCGTWGSLASSDWVDRPSAQSSLVRRSWSLYYLLLTPFSVALTPGTACVRQSALWWPERASGRERGQCSSCEVSVSRRHPPGQQVASGDRQGCGFALLLSALHMGLLGPPRCPLSVDPIHSCHRSDLSSLVYFELTLAPGQRTSWPGAPR